ncbi:hypothetical protein AALP_AA1G333400 [Arabis alpina]|uniref:FBD domain-containing protein n=1 Tax=Arabis alpina TaxID=50452 RepID=A0A087HSB1_ARAAL|nr:hypothetical protein AALP_AA1G333400 [Arabis alpina]
MDEDGEKRYGVVDWISNLPDSLKFEILLNLPTKEVSLLSLTYFASGYENLVEDLVVVIDAPRLEYLSLRAHRIASFELNNLASLVKADIDMVYDHPKTHVIQNVLRGISSVKDLIISSSTLEVIYNYSRCETLPLFRNLSSLRVEFDNYKWEMLLIFLESCPNLKSLVMGSTSTWGPKKEGSSIIYGPQCLLTSLEYVEIERPLKGEAMEMKLVGYLLENSTILKKLNLRLDKSIKKEEYVVLKEELLTIPRLSTSCQVVVSDDPH